jgi:hypothetical protein
METGTISQFEGQIVTDENGRIPGGNSADGRSFDGRYEVDPVPRLQAGI